MEVTVGSRAMFSGQVDGADLVCEVIVIRTKDELYGGLALPREAMPRTVQGRTLGPGDVVGKMYAGVTSLDLGDAEMQVTIARASAEILESTPPLDVGVDVKHRFLDTG